MLDLNGDVCWGNRKTDSRDWTLRPLLLLRRHPRVLAWAPRPPGWSPPEAEAMRPTPQAFSPQLGPWRDTHGALLPGQQPAVTVNSARSGLEPVLVVSPPSEGKQRDWAASWPISATAAMLCSVPYAWWCPACLQPCVGRGGTLLVLPLPCSVAPRWVPSLGSTRSSQNVPTSPSDGGPFGVLACSVGTARSVLGNEDALPWICRPRGSRRHQACLLQQLLCTRVGTWMSKAASALSWAWGEALRSSYGVRMCALHTKE